MQEEIDVSRSGDSRPLAPHPPAPAVTEAAR